MRILIYRLYDRLRTDYLENQYKLVKKLENEKAEKEKKDDAEVFKIELNKLSTVNSKTAKKILKTREAVQKLLGIDFSLLKREGE